MKRYLEKVNGKLVYREFKLEPLVGLDQMIEIPEGATFATSEGGNLAFRKDGWRWYTSRWDRSKITLERVIKNYYPEMKLEWWVDAPKTFGIQKAEDETIVTENSDQVSPVRKSVVYKYPVPILENFQLDLPKGSRIVRIAHIDGFSWLWALTPVGEKEIHRYYFKGSKTGGEFEHENDLIFVGMHAIYVQMELALYAFLDKIEKIEEDGTLTPVLTPFNVIANSCWTT